MTAKKRTAPAPLTWHTARAEATSTGWHFALPAPERTNAAWRQWKGRTIVSAKHRQDKTTAASRFGPMEPFHGDVRVRLVWVRQRRVGDIDGRVKATLDLLTLIGVWGDDAQVKELAITRTDDPSLAPGMYCWVEPADLVRRAA